MGSLDVFVNLKNLDKAGAALAKSLGASAASFGKALAAAISEAFEGTKKKEPIKELTKDAETLKERLKEVWKTSEVKGWVDHVKGAFHKVTSFFKNLFTDFGGTIKNAFGGAIDWIKKKFSSIKETLKNVTVSIAHALLNPVETVKKAWKGVTSFMSNLFSGFGIPDLAGTILKGLGLYALYSEAKDIFNELDDLYENTGKTAALSYTSAGTSFGKMQATLVGTALDVKEAMPTLEMKEITETMGQFAMEGIKDQKMLRGIVPAIGAMGHFVGETAKAIVPMVSSMLKLGRTVPNLKKGLGGITAAFGQFAGEGLKAVSTLTRLTTAGDFNKIAAGANKLMLGLKEIGATGEEATDFVSTLMSSDITKMPPIFQPLAGLRKDGPAFAAAVGSTLDQIQNVARGTSDEMLALSAEAMGVPVELFAMLKQQSKSASEIFSAAKEKAPDVTELYNKATDTFGHAFKFMKETVGLDIMRLLNDLRPAFMGFARGVKHVFVAIRGAFKSFLAPFKEAGKGVFQTLGAKIQSVFDGIAHWIQEGHLTYWLHRIKTGVEEFFVYAKPHWEAFKVWIQDVGAEFAKFLKGGQEGMKEGIVKFLLVDFPAGLGTVISMISWMTDNPIKTAIIAVGIFKSAWLSWFAQMAIQGAIFLATNPIGWVLAGIMGIVLALELLDFKWKKAWEDLKYSFSWWGEKIGAVWNVIKVFSADVYNWIAGLIGSAFDYVAEKANMLIQRFVGLFAPLSNMITPYVSGIQIVFTTLQLFISSVVKSIGDYVNPILEGLGNWIDTILKKFDGVIQFGKDVAGFVGSYFGEDKPKTTLANPAVVAASEQLGKPNTPIAAAVTKPVSHSSSASSANTTMAKATAKKAIAKKAPDAKTVAALGFAAAMTTDRKDTEQGKILNDIKSILVATYQIDQRGLESQIGTQELQKWMVLQSEVNSMRNK